MELPRRNFCIWQLLLVSFRRYRALQGHKPIRPGRCA